MEYSGDHVHVLRRNIVWQNVIYCDVTQLYKSVYIHTLFVIIPSYTIIIIIIIIFHMSFKVDEIWLNIVEYWLPAKEFQSMTWFGHLNVSTYYSLETKFGTYCSVFSFWLFSLIIQSI